MAGSPPPDEIVDDRQQGQQIVPAPNLPEAWPIAHIAAYRELAAPLAALHDSLAAGTGLSTSPSAMQRQIMGLLEQINELTNQRWAEYIKAAAAHPLDADSLKSCGIPEHITYDAKHGIPFLTWMTLKEGPVYKWQQYRIAIKEDTSGEPFVLTPPFRPVNLDSLPTGTLRINLTDPVHAATSAVYEVMEAAYADLTRAKATVSARDNWVRMRCVANFYTAIVQARMKELSLDDYRDWQVTLPAQIPVLNAPAIIARHGSNVVVIQLMALRTVTAFLLDSLDRAESEPSNHDQAQMVDQVLKEMSVYLERVRARHDSLNHLLVAENAPDAHGYVMQPISRPFPRGTPLIAMIPPEQAKASLVNVTELRRS